MDFEQLTDDQIPAVWDCCDGCEEHLDECICEDY